jgi:hypothetical protein
MKPQINADERRPPMNADKRRYASRRLSALIRVYLRCAFICGFVVLICGFICLAFCGTALAQEQDQAAPPAEQKPRGETRLSLSLTNEGSFYGGRRLPLPGAGNLLLFEPSFAYRRGERWRFSTSLAGTVNTYQETHALFRVKETYFGATAGDWDFAIGKKIVRWGTGYAFTPTGVLDPPRVATDPSDRLGLNEGREMVEANWIRGRHSLTAAWASGGLLERHRPGMRETAAARYNTLLAHFDTSLIYAHDRGGVNFVGGNFTRVFGQAVEVHGELARRTGSEFVAVPGLARPLYLPENTRTAVLLGAKYTHATGLGAILEFYSADGLLKIIYPPPAVIPAEIPASVVSRYTERKHYLFVRVGKSRLRELPGWKEWDVFFMLIANASDGSRVAIIETERRIGNRFSTYARAMFPAGKAWQSEYGMIPYQALVWAGFRFQL